MVKRRGTPQPWHMKGSLIFSFDTIVNAVDGDEARDIVRERAERSPVAQASGIPSVDFDSSTSVEYAAASVGRQKGAKPLLWRLSRIALANKGKSLVVRNMLDAASFLVRFDMAKITNRDTTKARRDRFGCVPYFVVEKGDTIEITRWGMSVADRLDLLPSKTASKRASRRA